MEFSEKSLEFKDMKLRPLGSLTKCVYLINSPQEAFNLSSQIQTNLVSSVTQRRRYFIELDQGYENIQNVNSVGPRPCLCLG